MARLLCMGFYGFWVDRRPYKEVFAVSLGPGSQPEECSKKLTYGVCGHAPSPSSLALASSQGLRFLPAFSTQQPHRLACGPSWPPEQRWVQRPLRGLRRKRASIELRNGPLSDFDFKLGSRDWEYSGAALMFLGSLLGTPPWPIAHTTWAFSCSWPTH